jgi:hypothetical protein
MRFKVINLANLLIILSVLLAGWITSEILMPELHYHFQQIAFNTGIDFFKIYYDYPGGISDYFAQFVAQFFNYKFTGSFLIVAIASLQGLIALSIIKMLVGENKVQFTVFMVILFFGVAVFTSYYYPYYATTRLLFAFIFIWIFCFFNCKYPNLSIAIWFMAAGILFYVAGGPALFVFAFSAACIFIINNNQPVRLFYVPGLLLVAGLLPWFGYEYLFQMTLKNIYSIIISKPPAMLQYTPGLLVYGYYLLLPVMVLSVLIIKKITKKATPPSSKGKETGVKIRFYRNDNFIIFFQAAACFTLGYFLFLKFYDPVKKRLLMVDYYAEHEQWTELLATTKDSKQYDFMVNFQGGRALSHLGQLPERLFEYPQLLGTSGLFIDATLAKSAAMPTSDLFFDLGYMAESQHWAFEAQTLLPESPRILKRLIMINLIYRKYDLAKQYLGILQKNMLYRDWTGKYLQYVSDTTLADSDKLIAEKRLLTPLKTFINTGNEGSLRLLLETNPNNRMAYEYLLSYYLLDINSAGFVEYLKLYKNFKIKKLPKSWEEGLVFYVAKTKTLPENLPVDLVSKSCIQRFSDFSNKVKPYQNNFQAAKSLVYREYGNTFWYYFLYLNPKVTNVLDKKAAVK